MVGRIQNVAQDIDAPRSSWSGADTSVTSEDDIDADVIASDREYVDGRLQPLTVNANAVRHAPAPATPTAHSTTKTLVAALQQQLRSVQLCNSASYDRPAADGHSNPGHGHGQLKCSRVGYSRACRTSAVAAAAARCGGRNGSQRCGRCQGGSSSGSCEHGRGDDGARESSGCPRDAFALARLRAAAMHHMACNSLHALAIILAAAAPAAACGIWARCCQLRCATGQ